MRPQIRTGNLLLLTGCGPNSWLPVCCLPQSYSSPQCQRSPPQSSALPSLFEVIYQTSWLPLGVGAHEKPWKGQTYKNLTKWLVLGLRVVRWRPSVGRCSLYIMQTSLRFIFKFTFYMLLIGLCPTSVKVFFYWLFAFSKSRVNSWVKYEPIQNLKIAFSKFLLISL